SGFAMGLLPPTAQSLVQLNERRQHIPLGLGEVLLGGQPLAFSVENLQVAADSAGVTRTGELALVAKRLGEDQLAAAVLAGFAVADQRVGDIAKSSVD